MQQFIHPSIAEIEEESIVQQLIESPLWCDFLFNVVDIDRDSTPLASVPLTGLAGNYQGDIDILLVPPRKPERCTAIQVKRIKVDADALRTGRPNGLQRIEKGKRQAGLLAEIGFRIVYLYVFVQVDSREHNAGKVSYQGLTQSLRSMIYQAVSTLGLGPRVGLMHQEFAQPMDHPPLSVGSFGGQLVRLATPGDQPQHVTEWVARASSLRFKTETLNRSLRGTCQEVLSRFPLYEPRVLCFIDDENPPEFDKRFGPKYCGAHTPIIGGGDWPHYVEQHFLDMQNNFAYDNLIYINGRTSATKIGSAITLAHELQHFGQYASQRKVWLANTAIYHLLLNGPPTTIRPWDLPYERDTMRVSKQIAEEIFGEAATKAFVADQVSDGKDPEKWSFFQRLSYREPFDLLKETRPWVERYKADLLKTNYPDIDFSSEAWWV